MSVIDRQLFEDSFKYFDKEIVAEIIDIFLNEYDDRLKAISDSIKAGDFKNLQFNAHSLKGVVANFAAPEVQERAKILEYKGSSEDGENLTGVFEELKHLTLQLAEELKERKNDYS